MNRRHFGKTLGGAVLAAAATRKLSALDSASTPTPRAEHDVAPLDIVFVVYPHFTPLDMFGPHHALQFLPGARMHVVARSRETLVTEGGITIQPTATFDEAPRDPAILFVPGAASGMVRAVEDAALVDFVADRGSRAAWVTSVCTGSMILGAAGLLRGYRATSHWLTHEVLASLGAIPVHQRVVEDRNRITAAGVTAGIDFGLAMVARLGGQTLGHTAQLMAEYDPNPPFDVGTPEKAGAFGVQMKEHHAALVTNTRRATAAAMARRGA